MSNIVFDRICEPQEGFKENENKDQKENIGARKKRRLGEYDIHRTY